MMDSYSVQRSLLKGEINIPPSKSHTLRAILFGTLGQGRSYVYNCLPSPDTQAMLQACRLLGAGIHIESQSIVIDGLGGTVKQAENVIDAGNSGLVLRFCAAVGALAPHPIVITGDASIRYQRPMATLLNALEQLGVAATSMRGDGYAPVIIKGPLLPGAVTFNGADSQPVSALLIAAAFASGPISLYITQPGEKPWVAVTLSWFDRLGINYQRKDFESYHLKGMARYEGFQYTVPGDWSSAAFPIAAALITGSEIAIKNVDIQDTQGDKEIIQVLQQMGAHIEIDIEQHIVYVKKNSTLTGITVDVNAFIDAIPILAVVACYAEGRTHLYNAAIARHKECDRISCLASELTKMGADITETEDGLYIIGTPLKGSQLHAHGDHRMAMALTIAALGASGKTTLTSVECINKTFPTFVHDFKMLGANIEG